MTECLSFMNLNMILSLILFFLSFAFPILHLLFGPSRLTCEGIAEMFLKYSLFFNVGCLFILGCLGQFLYAPEIAQCIGWSWSPFQYELAFSEMAIGLLGLLSPIFYRQFWLATIIATAVWLLGASAVHIYYLLVLGNVCILNASFVIGWNIVIAVWLLSLYTALAKPLAKLFKVLDMCYSARS